MEGGEGAPQETVAHAGLADDALDAIPHFLLLLSLGGCIDLLERIKRTYSTTGGSESDVLKIYKTVPLLVIDDIGKEPPTEWAISTVYNIINGRYEAYLPTIVTTNYDTEALIDRMTPRESHDSMTARATIDRLMEMCRGITLTGQSWRSR